jgi:hypothetical protein
VTARCHQNHIVQTLAVETSYSLHEGHTAEVFGVRDKWHHHHQRHACLRRSNRGFLLCCLDEETSPLLHMKQCDDSLLQMNRTNKNAEESPLLLDVAKKITRKKVSMTSAVMTCLARKKRKGKRREERDSSLINMDGMDVAVRVGAGAALFAMGVHMLADVVKAAGSPSRISPPLFLSHPPFCSDGDRLRRFLFAFTRHRLLSIFLGFLLTGLSQSVTITSLILLSLSHRDLITQEEGICMLIGAGIGSTVIGYLIAFKV